MSQQNSLQYAEQHVDTATTHKRKSSQYWLEEDDDSDLDAVLEAEIDSFYKIMGIDENTGPNSDDDWKDDTGPISTKHVKGEETEEEMVESEKVISRESQLELLAESSSPCVFLTVHRMYTMYEFQLWDIVPIATLKELLEDITEVSPECMRIYQQDGSVLEDSKTLKDYGITPNINNAENPAKLFVGFQVDLEEASNEEGDEEEEEDEENNLSPGLEYFETVSDIDFTEEIARDRDYLELENDVDFGPGYKLEKPETEVADLPFKKDFPKTEPDFTLLKEFAPATGLEEQEESEFDFVPFTLNHGSDKNASSPHWRQNK